MLLLYRGRNLHCVRAVCHCGSSCGDCEVSYAAPAQVVEYIILLPQCSGACTFGGVHCACTSSVTRCTSVPFSMRCASTSREHMILVAVAHREGVHLPRFKVDIGAPQVLAPPPTTAVEIALGPCQVRAGPGRPPMTVMTTAVAPVVVSSTVVAQKPQVTTAATVYQEGCSRSHDDRDHHGACNASDDSVGIFVSRRGVHRACHSCVSRRGCTG